MIGRKDPVNLYYSLTLENCPRKLPFVFFGRIVRIC